MDVLTDHLFIHQKILLFIQEQLAKTYSHTLTTFTNNRHVFLINITRTSNYNFFNTGCCKL